VSPFKWVTGATRGETTRQTLSSRFDGETPVGWQPKGAYLLIPQMNDEYEIEICILESSYRRLLVRATPEDTIVSSVSLTF
jgi:hypothetical protein